MKILTSFQRGEKKKKKNHTDFVVFGWQLCGLLRGLNRCMEYI